MFEDGLGLPRTADEKVVAFGAVGLMGQQSRAASHVASPEGQADGQDEGLEVPPLASGKVGLQPVEKRC